MSQITTLDLHQLSSNISDTRTLTLPQHQNSPTFTNIRTSTPLSTQNDLGAMRIYHRISRQLKILCTPPLGFLSNPSLFNGPKRFCGL